MRRGERAQLRALEREAIAELAIGVLDSDWVAASGLADLIGVSVQAIHAALSAGVFAGQFEKRFVRVRVSRKAGSLDRVHYRRARKQPVPLPAWLDPAIVPPVGVFRMVMVLGDENCQTI